MLHLAPLEDERKGDELKDQGNGKGPTEPGEKLPGSKKSDWEEQIDLSRISDDKLRGEVMSMLRKHSGLWDGTLGTI